jgi:hypothetical protein
MKKNRKNKRRVNTPLPAAAKRRFPRWPAGLLALAIMAAGGFWFSKSHDTAATPVSAAPAGTEATNHPVAAASNGDFQKLKGKWLRPDGGYVLEISSVENSGKLEASYSNPRPIHVAKAEASLKDRTVKVFIELRDINYPGSTYDLTYDAQQDQLAGIYYQAALQQQFEVNFVRMK